MPWVSTYCGDQIILNIISFNIMYPAGLHTTDKTKKMKNK